MQARYILPVLLTASLLSACGGESTAAPEPKKEVNPGSLDSAALQRGLLKTEELPTGFSVSESSDPQKSATEEGVCGKPPLAEKFTPAAKAGFSASKGGAFGTLLSETIVSYSTADIARERMDAYRADATCSTYEVTTSSGTKQSNRVGALSFPKIADDTHALHMSAEGAIAAGADIVIVRKDNVVVEIVMGGVAQSSSIDEGVVRKAVEKATTELKL